MPGNPWSKAEDSILVRMWTQGIGARIIAADPTLAANQRTRNSVISRAHRLSLPPQKNNHVRPKPTGMTAAQPRKTSRFDPATPEMPESRPETFEPLTPKDSLGVPTGGAVGAILALTPKACRFPIGDPRSPTFHFCGDPQVPGLSYCASCAKKAYQPPSLRVRSDDRLRQTVVTKEKQSV